jgi:hypothetical protein
VAVPQPVNDPRRWQVIPYDMASAFRQATFL